MNTAVRTELHAQLDAALPPHLHPHLNTRLKRQPSRYLNRRVWPPGTPALDLGRLTLALSSEETRLGPWPPKTRPRQAN